MQHLVQQQQLLQRLLQTVLHQAHAPGLQCLRLGLLWQH
jgi:hypothetical protein